MRVPEAKYDHKLNIPSVNQQQAIRTFFEFTQEVRRQASGKDLDSPGELTSAEVLTAALSKFPDGAAAIVAMLNDDVAMGRDILNVSIGVVQQLDVAGDITRN